jgi:hypothetical protein
LGLNDRMMGFLSSIVAKISSWISIIFERAHNLSWLGRQISPYNVYFFLLSCRNPSHHLFHYPLWNVLPFCSLHGNQVVNKTRKKTRKNKFKAKKYAGSDGHEVQCID